MGNKYSADGPEYIDLSFQYYEPVGDKFKLVPSVGETLDFFVAEKNSSGYSQTSETYKITLGLPKTPNKGELINGTRYSTHELVKKAVEELTQDTDFFSDLGELISEGSNLIGIRGGRYLGFKPIKYFGEALKEQGYNFSASPEEPNFPYFAQIGGRKRIPINGFEIYKEEKK